VFIALSLFSVKVSVVFLYRQIYAPNRLSLNKVIAR
jgi:hypothetical protein